MFGGFGWRLSESFDCSAITGECANDFVVLQYDRLALNVFDQLLTGVQKCADEQFPLEREALEHGRTESLGAVQGICGIESARSECGTGERLRIKQCALY